MMKLKRWIAVLLVFFLLTGCTVQSGDLPQGTTMVTESTVATTPAETTQPPIVLEAINALFSRKTTTGVDICVLDQRTVALITGGYVGEGFSSYQTQICLNDIYTDTLVAETTLEGEYTIVSSYADGIALGCEKNGQIILLDRMLQQTTSIQVKEQDGIVTSATTYHYLRGNDLYCMDIGTGETQRLSMERELPLVELLGYDPARNLLMCTAFVDPYTVGTCPATIDLNTNSFVFLSSDYVTGTLTQNGFYLQGETQLQTADAFYGAWDTQLVYSLEKFATSSATISTWHIPGTDYIYRLTYDKNQMDIVDKAELFRLGETLEVCELPEPLNDVKVKKVFALPDGNLLVLSSNRRGFQLYLICPDQLMFVPAVTPQSQTLAYVDETVYETYEQAAVTEEVAEQLSEVRQDADALEEEYGVTILMSNQCAAAIKSSGKSVVTTDQAQLDDEAAWIDGALNQLEKVFKLYPEGFFRQFQNDAQQKGILILLIGDIVDNLNVIGFCYTMGDWSIVAVDVTSGEVFQTYCHEFWHATEFKIERENLMCFSDENWSRYNPEGFRYSYNTTPGYINDVDNTLFYNQNDKDIYFIDPYAKTNPYEDRARLMEYVMYNDHYAKRIAQIPALHRKLKHMSEAIRETFDTTGWGMTRWERFSQ